MAVLTHEMEAAVERLRAAFRPEEIVLFGSRAYGMPRSNSDVDLLVVLRPGAEPPAVRERLAREALEAGGRSRVDGHVWAYTPQELREQLRRGSTALRDALAKGRRLVPGEGPSRYAELAGEWSATGAKETLLEKAQDDLGNAEIVLETGGARRQAWWLAAFHAQQAAEKALKALIYHLGGEPERTHGLAQLASKASEMDPAQGRRLLVKYQPRLAELETYAVQPRYVDAPPVNEKQAREAVSTARDLLEDVTAIVGA